MSIGVIPWPVVFLTTDLINEYFGKAAVRRLTFMTAGMILYAYKFLIAVALTPFLYLLHHLIDRFLGKSEAERLIEEAAQSSVAKSS